jgi:hypothetical protein
MVGVSAAASGLKGGQSPRGGAFLALVGVAGWWQWRRRRRRPFGSQGEADFELWPRKMAEPSIDLAESVSEAAWDGVLSGRARGG